MKKIHLKIQRLQARALDKAIKQLVIKKIPVTADEDELYQAHVARNNRRFNPIKGIVPALKVSKKAQLVRHLDATAALFPDDSVAAVISHFFTKRTIHEWLLEEGHVGHFFD